MTRVKLVSISCLLIFIKGFLINLTTSHLKTKILKKFLYEKCVWLTCLKYSVTKKVLKVVNLTLVFSSKYRCPEHYFSVWSLWNSQKLVTTNQFLVSTIFFIIMNITFFSLHFDLFSIIAKEFNQIRRNVVCVVARLIFLFCCALSSGRCNAFQHIFVN